jgi:hypothetical protein
MSARRSTRWRPRSRRRPGGMSRWPTSMPATADQSRRPAPLRRASSWSSSRPPRPNAASSCCPRDGWWREPSHSTYNPLLTPKLLSPMIGLTGLLNLLAVVARRHVARQDCMHAPQEAGVPCPASPPDQRMGPALPPTLESAQAQPVGAVTTSQSATAPASAQSSRRTAAKRPPASPSRQPGGGRV